MLQRSVKARAGQRMLIHGASGGVGSAMLQLAKLAGVEMYGTCSAKGAVVVRKLGGIPIDYKDADFLNEIRRLTRDGVDAVFDGIRGREPVVISRSRARGRPGCDVWLSGKNAWRTHAFAQRGASSLS
jgi:NADPH:quinone reductase-like Zn-dependent oxidoreductase